MENFIFNIPTRAYFGKGSISNLATAIKEFGGTKVLLTYGGGSIKRNGIYDAVLSQLKEGGIDWVELSDIKPNPRIESAEDGIALYRDNQCDFILAVGGGSTLDASKAMAAGIGYKGPIIDLLTGAATVEKCAPLATILTMAGTGSEMDCGGVITTGDDNKKRVIVHPDLYPKFSILDPEYTFTVSMSQSMAGAADILCHLMEQYFTPDYGAEVQDRMNEGLMKAVLENAPKLLQNASDYNARANIMWASSMALSGFQLMLGKVPYKFPIHYIGHELSSLYDMTHGVTLALITPAWMRQTIRLNPDSLPIFGRFARNVFGIDAVDDRVATEEAIIALQEWYQLIGMPMNLKEAGVEEDKLEYLAQKATEIELGCLTCVGKTEALEILKESFCTENERNITH